MKGILLEDLIEPAGPKAGADTDHPVYSVTKHGGFVPSAEYFKKQIFSRELSAYKRVSPGDFAYATIHLDEGSIGIAPADGLISPMYTVFRPIVDRVDPGYLLRYMKSPAALAQYPRFGKGSVHRRKSISLSSLGKLMVPVPSIEEQRRIAAILGKVDALRAMRREVITCLDGLIESIFVDAFDDDVENATASLDEVAVVSSGITKGRKTSEPTRAVPYLAVVNVQAGQLNLDIVKEIEATEAEIKRYSLCDGDLVLTEGGDPDKLGRGTVWRSELPLCLHQNHIFRVRIQPNVELDPDYLAAYMTSRPAISYFLRAAKQTTGIASINMTQLKRLPVYVPSKWRQDKYLERVDRSKKQRKVLLAESKALDQLFESLRSRAFAGKL